MCFELGRFPYELPSSLPDEQMTLMYAYLALRNEKRNASTTAGHISRARAAEARLQDEEAEAWATSRKQVTGG